MAKTWLKFIGPPLEILIGAAIIYYNYDKGGVFKIAGYLIVAMGLISLAIKLYLTFGRPKKQ